MATKSPAEIIEGAIVAHLSAQTELSGVNIERGIEVDKTQLPLCVVTSSNIGTVNELPEGLGNFRAMVVINVITSADESSALTVHRARTAAVLGAMQDVAAIKTAFSSSGDATCYDATFESTEEGQGDRALMASASYSVLIVLPA